MRIWELFVSRLVSNMNFSPQNFCNHLTRHSIFSRISMSGWLAVKCLLNMKSCRGRFRETPQDITKSSPHGVSMCYTFVPFVSPATTYRSSESEGSWVDVKKPDSQHFSVCCWYMLPAHLSCPNNAPKSARKMEERGVDATDQWSRMKLVKTPKHQG